MKHWNLTIHHVIASEMQHIEWALLSHVCHIEQSSL